jgi:hypothetical protein
MEVVVALPSRRRQEVGPQAKKAQCFHRKGECFCAEKSDVLKETVACFEPLFCSSRNPGVLKELRAGVAKSPMVLHKFFGEKVW